MKRILIDTNIILDLLAKRAPFYKQAKQIFSLADTKQIELVISTLNVANTYYILNDILKIKDVRSIIRKFKVLVNSYPLNDKIVELALNDDNYKDFEDSIQYYSALESNCKLILTRNTKDFKKSDIPILKPKEYLTKIKMINNH